MSPSQPTAPWFDHALRDLRHALRAIARMPVLATVVVLSLAVGIGVNTVVFSWIQAVVLEPLPGVPGAASFQLVVPRGETGTFPASSWAEYRDLKVRLRSFPELIAVRMAPFNVGDDGRTERTYGQFVSGNFFPALRLQPALGRFLRPDEVERPASDPVVVISHEYWQTRYAGAPGVLDQTIRVNGLELTIVGVAPRDFQGTVLALQFDLWIPATLAPMLFAGSNELEDRGSRGYSLMGKLGDGVTREEAQAELTTAMQELAAAYPESNAGVSGELADFWNPPAGPQRMFVSGLVFLQGVMLLLLLAVCGNTANLLLARASSRQREIGVRLALGAARWRITSLLLTENLVLALLGSALSAVIAIWGTQALRAAPLTGALPIRFQTSVDATGLAFAIGLGILCGLLFGLAPATQLSRTDPQLALRAGANTAARGRLRNALMGTEVALAIAVLLVAALFFRSFTNSRSLDPGFQREGLLLAAYDLSSRRPDDAASLAFATRLLDALRRVPGVEAAAIAGQVPLDIHGMASRSFQLEGRARDDSRPDRATMNVVTPEYFKAMGIPFRAGGDFAALNDASTPPQAIVNQEFVARYMGATEPIGRRITAGDRTYVIAGVVRTSLYNSFGEAPTPIIYYSYRDRPWDRGELHVRARSGSEMLVSSEIRRIVRELDSSLPVYDFRTMNEHVEKNLFLRRIPARMFVVLGPLLLLLASIGIYAVVAYSVAQRTTEIGVRLALGATGQRVIVQIVGQTLRVIAIGAGIGWFIVLVLDRHILPGRALDVTAFALVPLILLSVATLACWLPARRATLVNPIEALRHE